MAIESVARRSSAQGPGRGGPFFGWISGWWVVVEWLVFFTFVSYFVLPRWASADLQFYVLQPILWLSLGGLSLWLWRQENRAEAPASDKGLVALAALLGIFQVVVWVLAGLLGGFGRSPYASRPSLMLLNLWYVGARLVGLEWARWYLLTALRRRPFLGISLTWLLFTAASIPPASLFRWQWSESTFRFVGNMLLPEASENLLATYLALTGGPWAAVAYRVILFGFEWLSPILPTPRWTLTAFLGTLTPIVGLLIVRDLRGEDRETTSSVSRSSGNIAWVFTTLVASFVVWFNLGLFGVRPSLVSGVSMLPVLRTGDIVISREVNPSEVRVGDIVCFRLREGGSSIVHRVIEIREEGGRRVFITKGDNNNVADQPWDESLLQGKAVLVIRKVGLVSIYLRQFLQSLFF